MENQKNQNYSAKRYEDHNLEDKNLPIIFHYDVARRNNSDLPNWHGNIEILYCMKGSGEVNCSSVVYNVQKGDLFVINSNNLHNTRTGEEFEYYCLIIDSDFLRENGIFAENIEIEALVKSEYAGGIYERIAAEFNAQNPYRIAAIRAGVLELMVYLSRNHRVKNELKSEGRESLAEETVKAGRADNERIKHAIGYIKANFERKVSLEEVAGEVGLSKYHFSREFKKATGMNFIAFLNGVRCRNAKKLLAMKKYSIHEIAQKCGFENDSYFSRTFKEIMGHLPSHYE